MVDTETRFMSHRLLKSVWYLTLTTRTMYHAPIITFVDYHSIARSAHIYVCHKVWSILQLYFVAVLPQRPLSYNLYTRQFPRLPFGLIQQFPLQSFLKRLAPPLLLFILSSQMLLLFVYSFVIIILHTPTYTHEPETKIQPAARTFNTVSFKHPCLF